MAETLSMTRVLTAIWRVVAPSLTLIFFLAVGLCGLVAMGMPAGAASVVWPVVGAWLLIVGAFGFTTILLWGLAKRIVGVETHVAYGFRTSALAVSLLVAGATAPAAALDLMRIGEVVTRLALVTTPQLVVDARAQEGLRGAARDEHANDPAAQLLSCMAADWPFKQDRDRPWRHVRTSSPPNAYCPPLPERWEATARDWFLFAGVMLLCLVLSRSLYSSYNKQYGPPGQSRRAAITYGQWLALLIYGAIVIPSGYLAIGSLVLLQSEPDAASAPSLAPPAPAADEALNTTLDTTKAAADPVRAYRAQVMTQAETIDLKYLKFAAGAAATLQPSRLDARIRELQLLRAVSRDTLAARLDACRAAHPEAGATPAEAAKGARPAGAPTEVTTTASGVVKGRATDATSPAAPAASPAPIAGPGATPTDACATSAIADTDSDNDQTWEAPIYPPLGLVDRVYPWLDQDRGSRPILMIMGLLGFGLLGAAIRAMGRTSNNLVEDLPKAPGADHAVTKLNPTEFGKIIVQGAGAAMVVFLGFQAGALVFAGKASDSPFPQLLFSFLGAVFAEEVWDWGDKALQAYLSKAKAGGEGAPQARQDLQDELDKAAVKARQDLSAARSRMAALDEAGKRAVETPLKTAEDTLESQLKAAQKTFTDLDACWNDVKKSPTPDSLAKWNTQLQAARGAVAAGVKAANDAQDEAQKLVGPTQPPGL
jgi:hypothetical protein